jgi:predicted glycosyltransferase involved in capsule biosynthesis
MFKTAIIITVKGRREHLEHSLPLLPLENTIVVDQGCPEGSGDWAIDKGAHVVFDKTGPTFQKPRALNTGAQKAKELGFNYLLFLDADTLVQPGFFAWVRSNASQTGFQIVLSTEECRDLTGILGVSVRNFFLAKGFDNDIKGYGLEDIDLRLRLHFIQKLKIQPILRNLLKTIQHDDNLRVQFHENKNLLDSATKNQHFVCAKLAALLGFPLNHLYENENIKGNLVRLLGAEPERR